MKKFVTLLLLATLTLWTSAQTHVAVNSSVQQISIGDYLGSRINDCITHRVKGQDWDHLVEPFRNRTETWGWQSEFWGKWVQGAIGSYRYNNDPELYEMIRQSAEAMMATQSPDGYIGNYRDDLHLKSWDIWGRKYTMLGLIAWYDLSGQKKALKAACAVLDHLMSELGPDKVDIISTGNYHGMASCSVLEPVIYLYNRTGQERYLDYAKYIAQRLCDKDGPELIKKALMGVDVANRFPHPKQWFSPENGQKAYEMMSCYEGLLELYKITGEESYLTAVKRTVENIISTEINIAGSGSAFECWYGGKQRQTLPTYHTMETCVTFTWMQLCNRLLQLTQNPALADQIELSIYNALLASLRGDGKQISKYSPLEGWRSAGEEQCGMHINCCNANGPRGFALIPQAIYHTQEDLLQINLYCESKATLLLGGNRKQIVSISQSTAYPQEGTIEICVEPKRASEFTIALRIPEWSGLDNTTVKVNDKECEVSEHGWLKINRTWLPGDKITLNLDMRGRLIKHDNHHAIMRGPVVLARDSRFMDGDVDECTTILDKDGYITLKQAPKTPFAWMHYIAEATLGTDLEGHGKLVEFNLCDFSSAGNTWDKSVRYRVWLPRTLNVMYTPYVPYNRNPEL